MRLLGVTGRGNAPGDDSSGVARRPRARRDARPQAERLRVIPGAHPPLDVSSAAALPSEVVLERLASAEAGLSASEAQARLRAFGPNALACPPRHRPSRSCARQLRNPLLLLLLAAAAVSALTGDPTDAAIIAAIVALSVGLGLRQRVPRRERRRGPARATSTTRRSSGATAASARSTSPSSCPATSLLCGSGDIVPADLRLLDATSSSATRRSSPASRCRSPRRRRRAGERLRRSTCRRARSWAPSSIRAPAAASSSRRARRPRSGRSRPGSASGRPRPRSRSGCAASRAARARSPAC